MDFGLNEEQRAFRANLRRFVDREVIPVASEWERTDRYPTELVEQMKEMGLFGLTVPEEYGGLGSDMVSLALVFEEISRGWMGLAGILGSHSVTCLMIAKFGTQEQKLEFLPRLATGELRTGIALTEPNAGTDLQGIVTTARLVGDQYLVQGSKMWITNARFANPLPVLVKTDPEAKPHHRGMSILLIDTDSPGFSIGRDIGKLGYKGTESCEISLDEVRVPANRLLGGTEGRGMQQALSALECGRLNVASRAVGVAQAAYDAALEYSRNRKAFGQRIGDFQAIQMKIADMATQLQAARLLVYWAATTSESGGRGDVESGMAKLFASEVALNAAMEAMRVHGGYGYSTEFIVERLYRDAPLMCIGEGTNDIMRIVIAKQLLSGESVVGSETM